jgi:hypothetical protein
MKKKVRKFASGGDILTAAGAVLLGKHLYDKYKGGGDEKEPEAVGGAGRRARTVEEQIGRKADESKEPSAAEKRAMAASKGRPELIPEGADEAVMRSDNYPTPKPKPAVKKAKPAAQTTTTDTKSKTPASTKPSVQGGGLKSKPYPEGVKGTHENPFLTKSYMGALDKQRKIMSEDKDKAVKTKEQREFIERETPAYKKGGSVSSASKRADGIAQRGKTRGRVL